MRGCAPLGCGCGLIGLLAQIALLGVIVLLVGALLGVLPSPLASPGESALRAVFDLFDAELPPPICEYYPFLEEIFGRCN